MFLGFQQSNMLYKSDFEYFKTDSLVKRISLKKSLRLPPDKKPSIFRIIKTFWTGYCQQSSLHGIKYVVEKDLRPFERIIWAILVLFALFGTIYVCILLSHRFYDAPLETVVESTIFPISEIAFPAVTVCSFNRLKWSRIEDAKKKFLPGAKNSTVEIFEKFIRHFEMIEFGAFEKFKDFENDSLNELDDISLNDVYQFLMFDCEDLFEGKCWWRNRYITCCQHFILQKSESGLCWSFNSAVDSVGAEKLKTQRNWPRRTSSYGDWSGLRFNMFLDPAERIPASSASPGIQVMIHNPLEWPSSAQFLPSGTSASVMITPKFSYALQSTRRIPPKLRQCIFDNEAIQRPVKTLPGLQYLQNNCISHCKQSYLVKYCNCTVEFFFPIGNYTPCKASDFLCLFRHDSIFNYLRPFSPNSYFPFSEPGMQCDCLLECIAIDYKLQVTSVKMPEIEKENKMTVDVHFQHGTLMKYRTDVVYGWLDLMVSFGGIAGLFLGCSIISIAEFIYYMTVGLGVYLSTRVDRSPKLSSTVILVQPSTIKLNKNINKSILMKGDKF